MKSKKRLGFLSALLGVCMAVTSFTAVTAFADGETPALPEYVAKATNEDLINFENPIDYFTLDGKEIDVKKIKTVSVKQGGVALVDGTDYIYDATDDTIIYKALGNYDVTVTFTTDTTDVSATATVSVTDTVTPVAYDVDSAKVTAFNATVQAEVDTLGDDATTVEIPASFWDMVVSNVYTSKHINTKVYVAKPGADFTVVKSSWSSAMSKITISSSGNYDFYVELVDPKENTVVVDKDVHERRVDGWYDLKGNEDPSDDVMVLPIFTFNYTKEIKFEPKIEVKVSKGIVGQEYSQAKITSNGEKNTVTLLYNSSTSATAPTEANEGGWVVATAEHADFGTLTTTSTKFTPLVKGSFVLKLVATGGTTGLEVKTIYSNVIVVNREIQQQKLVNVKFRNFLKNNWLSLVFLGIAFLCIVGIVVLAFYKPKDETAKPAKKAKVEDEVEVVPETDVEEVEEVEEVVETEEVTEEVPAEEVTEEVAPEVPAEEVAPVEETPVEVAPETPVAEEVAPETPVETPAEDKPDGENA